VNKVGNVGVVSARTEQVKSFELAAVGRIEGRDGLHHHDLRGDVEVLGQLGLDILGHDVGIGQISADNVAIGDLGLKTIRVAGLGQQGAGGFGIEFIPIFAGATVGDGAGREVRRNFGTRRVEVVND